MYRAAEPKPVIRQTACQLGAELFSGLLINAGQNLQTNFTEPSIL
jgi:hypothetical protein